jgi:hypothetical protein
VTEVQRQSRRVEAGSGSANARRAENGPIRRTCLLLTAVSILACSAGMPRL